MKTIKETKYLKFIAEQKEGRKTKIIHIYDKSAIEEIAIIEWHLVWKQYCFIPEFTTVWDNTCLTEILQVLNDLMKERQVEKPKGE